MQFLNSGVSEFVLSPTERKQRHDVIAAISTLHAAVEELQNRVDETQPNLRCREILMNSDKALGTLRTFIDRQFETH